MLRLLFIDQNENNWDKTILKDTTNTHGILKESMPLIIWEFILFIFSQSSVSLGTLKAFICGCLQLRTKISAQEMVA